MDDFTRSEHGAQRVGERAAHPARHIVGEKEFIAGPAQATTRDGTHPDRMRDGATNAPPQRAGEVGLHQRDQMQMEAEDTAALEHDGKGDGLSARSEEVAQRVDNSAGHSAQLTVIPRA